MLPTPPQLAFYDPSASIIPVPGRSCTAKANGDESAAREASSVRLRDGIQVRHGRDIEDAVGGGGGRGDGLAKFDTADQLLFLACGKDREGAAAGAEVDLSVGHQGRGPDFAAQLVRPIRLAGFGIDAV